MNKTRSNMIGSSSIKEVNGRTEIWIDLEAYLFQGTKGIRIADSFLQQIEKVVLFNEKKKKVFEEVDLGIPENK